jgi:probable HAF family extracellular repeat protein
MQVTKTDSLAITFILVAAISDPSQRVQADTPIGAQSAGCSHLRYAAVPIAAHDGARLFPSDLNNKGEVVGGISDEGHSLVEAFFWKDGRYVRLGERVFSGALITSAGAVNDRSQIVGGIVTPDFNGVDYLLDKQGVQYLVGPFGFSREINDHGEIIGTAFIDGLLHGAIWRNGETVLLPMAPGHVAVNTADINNKGTVVGFGAAPGVNSEAVVWFAPYTDAPTIIALPANAISSPNVAGVNNRNQVIFLVALDPDPGTIGDDIVRSYVWSEGRPLQVLEPLPGFAHSSASDINTAGLIVGLSDAPGFTVATLWRGGQTCELRELVRAPGFEGQWVAAAKVNERGEILAFLDQSPVGAGWFVLRPTQAHH